MANLIKKIKIKKQDGTFTDYIPIGAEAQNIETSDGDSVQLKLNKKPYYYNSVADMKADTKLKAGDMAVTLGYYEANDGGKSVYKITTIKSETDYQEELGNRLYATLVFDEIIKPEQFGAYGDGIHDDTNAFINAINSQKNIAGIEEKTYKLNRIETNKDISILNCNFYTDAFESNTDVKFLFRTYSTNIKFDNCSFTSSFEYIPVINILNNLNQGKASNVIALRTEHGCEITNCKFNSIYGIDSRGKTIVDNCLFDNVEMGILGNTNDNILITNCTFNMNKLVNSQYYHALYIQAANSFISNNIFIKEMNEGQCGDHLHFKHPSLTTTTTPKAIISNCVISGDLSFPYLVQNNSAKLEINNLSYNGDTNGAFQTTDSGNITINNSNIKCNGSILFNCYGNIKVNNSIFNCTNSSLQLATKCNTEMNDTSIISTGDINMNRDIGSLTNNMFNCRIKANSINSLNCGGNGIVNNIMNCLYELITGNLNLSGRGFINAIIRNNSNPSTMGTVSDHNSYSLVIYQSNTYFKKIESLLN